MLEKMHEVYNFWCRAHSLSKIQPFSNTCSRNCYRERQRDTIFKMVWILISSESLVNINQNLENLKYKKTIILSRCLISSSDKFVDHTPVLLPILDLYCRVEWNRILDVYLALCLNEVRILIFDDPAELERRKRPKFCFIQLDSIDLKVNRSKMGT